MTETEPLYFKEFRKHIDHKFETHIPKYFLEFQKHIDHRFDLMDKKIEKEVGELAVSTADEFRTIDARFDGMEYDIHSIKESIGKIEGHIGRYEVRAQNIEEILLQDHKPRIGDLEKEVFG